MGLRLHAAANGSLVYRLSVRRRVLLRWLLLRRRGVPG
jgi:hypothetical protein